MNVAMDDNSESEQLHINNNEYGDVLVDEASLNQNAISNKTNNNSTVEDIEELDVGLKKEKNNCSKPLTCCLVFGFVATVLGAVSIPLLDKFVDWQIYKV